MFQRAFIESPDNNYLQHTPHKRKKKITRTINVILTQFLDSSQFEAPSTSLEKPGHFATWKQEQKTVLSTQRCPAFETEQKPRIASENIKRFDLFDMTGESSRTSKGTLQLAMSQVS